MKRKKKGKKETSEPSMVPGHDYRGRGALARYCGALLFSNPAGRVRTVNEAF